MPLLLAMGSPVGAVNPPSTWGEIFLFCISVKFAIFANMNDCNYTVRFISNITSGECPDDFWTSRSVSDNVSMTDSFTEKIVGGG